MLEFLIQSKKRLFSPVHPITIGLFRILTGILFLIHFIRLEEYFVEVLPKSKFLLTYDFFHWIDLLPKEDITLLFLLLKFASILYTIGLLYRVSVIFLFIGWTYLFLLDAGHYNNHYYLYSLILLLMCFIRADAWGSLNNVLFKKPTSPTPFWNIAILRFQFFVMYFYGGLAKLNWDWLNGFPVRYWFSDKSTDPFWNSFLNSEITVYFFCYGGLLFDLIIGFLLLFKKTRKLSVLFIVFFHFSNHFLWTIGTFPFFSIVATIVFFNPSEIIKIIKPKPIANLYLNTSIKKTTLFFLTVYALIQLLFPFRHHFYEGSPAWNGYGDSFAWRMMLTARTNATKFKVKIPSENIEGYVDINQYVNSKQFRRFFSEPKQAWRFAHFLEDKMIENGAKSAEIYAYIWKSVNGREFQLLLDTNINLANQPYSIFTKPEFILPMVNGPNQKTLYHITEKEFENKFKN